MTAVAAFDERQRLSGGRQGTRGLRSVLRVPSVETITLCLLLLLLAIVPSRSGSQSIEAQALNALVMAMIVILFEVSLLIRRVPHPVALQRFAVPALLFVLPLIWVLVQLWTALPGWMHHPAWQLAGETLAKPLAGRVTIDPDLTAMGAVRLATVAAVFWIAAQLGASPKRGFAILAGLTVIEVAYAAYALTVGSTPAPGDPAGAAATGSLTSTFANRNTYATYAGLGVLIAVAMGWRTIRHAAAEAGGSARLVVASIIRFSGGRGALWMGAILVLGGCLLMTSSRGGILATVVGLFVLVTLTLARQGSSRRGGARLLAPALALVGIVAVMILAVAVFGDAFLGRVSESGLGDAGRPYVYAKTAQAILASPWFGWGYGTFVSAFPLFADSTDDPFVAWDLAHNTYLEILLGCGLVAGTMMIASVVVLSAICAKGALVRQRDATLPALAAAASVLVGLHAMVDFSLQYQGVALTYAALLGIGFSQANEAVGSAGEKQGVRPARRGRSGEVA